jgi:hypothetical protein
MKRTLAALALALLAALPAAGQTCYSDLGTALYAHGYRATVYVVSLSGGQQLGWGVFNPAVTSYSGRYGHTVGASKGTLVGERFSPGALEQAIAPRGWMCAGWHVSSRDQQDAMLVTTAKGSKKAVYDILVGTASLPPVTTCPGSWSAEKPPQVVAGNMACPVVDLGVPFCCWYYSAGIFSAPKCQQTPACAAPPPPVEPPPVVCPAPATPCANLPPELADCPCTEPPVEPPPTGCDLSRLRALLVELTAAVDRCAAGGAP